MTSPVIVTCRLKVSSERNDLGTKSGSPSTCVNEQNVFFNEQPKKLKYDFEFYFTYSVNKTGNEFRGKIFAIPHFGVIDAKIRISKQNTRTSKKNNFNFKILFNKVKFLKRCLM